MACKVPAPNRFIQFLNVLFDNLYMLFGLALLIFLLVQAMLGVTVFNVARSNYYVGLGDMTATFYTNWGSGVFLAIGFSLTAIAQNILDNKFNGLLTRIYCRRSRR